MAVVTSTEAGNEALTALCANMDAGGVCQLRTGAGSGPDAAATGTLITSHTLSATAFAVASKVATSNAIGSAVAAATGTPGHARLTKPDGTTGVIHLTVGGSFIYTVNTGTNVLTTNVAHGYTANTLVRVFVESGGGLASPLVDTTDYYVIAPSGSDLQLSLTSGGAAIDLTAAGTGTQRITLATTDVALASSDGSLTAGVTVPVESIRLRIA